jgi:hypothetical protein
MFEKGTPVTAIAERFGVSVGRSRRFIEAGTWRHRRRSVRRRLTDSDVRAIRGRLGDARRMSLAERFGVTKGMISISGTGGGPRERPPVLHTQEPRVGNGAPPALRPGLSCTQIARAGISRQGVHCARRTPEFKGRGPTISGAPAREAGRCSSASPWTRARSACLRRESAPSGSAPGSGCPGPRSGSG